MTNASALSCAVHHDSLRDRLSQAGTHPYHPLLMRGIGASSADSPRAASALGKLPSPLPSYSAWRRGARFMTGWNRFMNLYQFTE